jgi:thioesterase domain-containing protein
MSVGRKTAAREDVDGEDRGVVRRLRGVPRPNTRTLPGDQRPGVPKGYRERRMAELFREVVGVDDVGAEDDFYALGGDAAGASVLLDVIEEDAGVRLPADAVVGSVTVRGLVERIGRSRATRRARIVGFGTDLPGPPLFCMMAAFQARTLARSFNASAGRAFYAVQQAGLEGRSRVDRSVRRRARLAVEDIRSVQPTGPYLLAGYSLDAHVACEVARRLREEGEEVDLLVAIDIWAPCLPRLECSLLRVKGRWKNVCERHPREGRPYDLLRLALFVRANVLDVTGRFKWWSLGWTAGVFPRRTAVQSELFYELTRTADRAYRARPLDLDIVAIRGEEFGGWEWRLRRTEADLSWHRVTSGHVRVMPVAADHRSMIEDEGAPALAGVLARAVQSCVDSPVFSDAVTVHPMP